MERDKELKNDKLAIELEEKLNIFLDTSDCIYVHASLRKNPWDKKDYYVEIRKWSSNYKSVIETISHELFELNVFRFVHNRYKDTDPYVINFELVKDEATKFIVVLDYLITLKNYNL